MHEEPKISIIVAVYNIEAYLPRCVDSIIGQTYQNLEILLVDDGSTDDSPAICDSYEKMDPRIRVIHKKNGGLSDARNAGLDAACGDYIGFVDGDDWIEALMYEALLTAVRRERAEVGVCRYKQITKGGVIDASTGNSVSLSREEALELYVCGHEQYVIYNSVWSKLFSASVIDKMRFPVGKNSEDILFTTKAFCQMNRCVYLDTAYYNYVLDREGSIMNDKAGERRLNHELPFWREQIAYFKSLGMDELADKAAYHFYRRLLFYYIEFMEQKSMHPYAKALAAQLKADKRVIKRIYGLSFVKKGDKVRMQVMQVCPGLYFCLVKGYERFIIPVRTGKKRGIEHE